MTDSYPHPVEPRQLTLLARVGWRLFPDPAAVAQLWDPLPADEIDRAVILLKRRNLLRALASRGLGIAITDPEPLRPEVRERFLRRFRRHLLEDGEHFAEFPSNRKSRKNAEHQLQEEEQIARAIQVAICDVWEEARDGKWKAFGLDPETKKQGQIDRAEFFRPSPLRRVVENGVGLYKDVMFERVEEPSEENPVTGEDEAHPCGRSNGAEVRQEPEPILHAPPAEAKDQGEGRKLLQDKQVIAWIVARFEAGKDRRGLTGVNRMWGGLPT
jgi:hypothetical protein